ncbi:MAG: hypothetical protein LAT82_05675 [Nanoarchaeota archaeon]|nr:hypothetical protein [Nanoarchaeota archaeon]
MDLHTIISNLHSGKRSIEQKELKTILKFNEISFNDSNLVGDYFALKSVVSSMYDNSNSLNASYKLKNEHRRGFILTHQGILLLLQENLVLQNISNIISKLKKPTSNFSSSSSSSSSNNNQNINSISNEKEISKASHQIQSILESIRISDLLKVQLSRVYNSMTQDVRAEVQRGSEIILKPKLSFTSNISKFENYSSTPLYISNNVKLQSLEDVFNSIKSILLEFYSEYNMQLRYDLGIIETQISLAVGFEEVLDAQVSGISSSIEYTTGHELISVIYSGFGEEVYNSINLTQVDVFEIFKYGFKNNFQGIFTSKIAQDKQTLSNSQIRAITSLTLDLEEKLTKYFKNYTPLKIYFSLTNSGKIIIEEIFLESKYLNLEKKELVSYEIIESASKPILQGVGLGNCIVHGKALIVSSYQDLQHITSQTIVITKDTNPQWQHYLLKAKALVVQRGNEFSHCAQMCYEHSIPVILQVGQFDHLISTGDFLTLDCSDINGFVYLGLEKYKIKHLSKEEIKQMQKNVSFNRITFDKKLLVHSSSKHILEKSHFPSSSECIENAFDLIPQYLKNQISLSFEDTKKEEFKLIIKNELVSIISKIAISKYPNVVYINIDSFCNNLYLLLISEKDYLFLNNQIGISRTIHPLYEKVLEFIIELIKEIKTSVGCTNISMYSTHIQEIKQLHSLNALLKKYSFEQKIGGVLGVGGIMNSNDIVNLLSFVACDLQELKQVCKKNNYEAISKLIHYAAPHTSKKNSYEFGLYNVTAQDVEILEHLMVDSYSFLTCQFEEFIPLYSFILFSKKNIKTTNLKFNETTHLKK